MEGYSAATSWALFGVLVAGGCYYYWPRDQRQHAPLRRAGRTEQDARAGQRKRPDERTTNALSEDASHQGGGELPRKRKAPTKQPSRPEMSPSVVFQDEEPEEAEADASTRQWAQQMMQAREGRKIGSGTSKEKQVRTVKQSNAAHTPNLSSGSSQGGAEADDDLSPAASPLLNAGDVSDMLEPARRGPSAIRLTAPTNPQKERVARQSKEEVVESKKQRQNRKKKEEQRLQREAEEKERKALEEKQRRSAREARGEPAKNGMRSAKAPLVSAWTTSTPASDAANGPIVNGSNNVSLLDTFDAESISSSNGGLDASTAATSTTSAGATQWDQDLPSEEDQIARAVKESGNESGWTTVAQPKKQKKKPAQEDAKPAEPVLTHKTNLPATRPAVNGKPKGFQALEVQYEQRTDADPKDASNWDA